MSHRHGKAQRRRKVRLHGICDRCGRLLFANRCLGCDTP